MCAEAITNEKQEIEEIRIRIQDFSSPYKIINICIDYYVFHDFIDKMRKKYSSSIGASSGRSVQ